MKTVIVDIATGIVLNVGGGEATTAPPQGIRYEVVDDTVYVGPGFLSDGAGGFDSPPDAS